MGDSEICYLYVSKIFGKSSTYQHYFLSFHALKRVLHSLHSFEIHYGDWIRTTFTKQTHLYQT